MIMKIIKVMTPLYTKVTATAMICVQSWPGLPYRRPLPASLIAGIGEHAGQDRAYGPADTVNAECIERIIVAEHWFELRHRVEGDHTCRNSDTDRTADIHEPCRRGYGHQSAYRA